LFREKLRSAPGAGDTQREQKGWPVLTRFLGGTVILLYCLLPLPAGAADCWDAVSDQHETGFDFVLESAVTGPSAGGGYTYTYRLYRIDQGSVTYRDPSHFTIRFACDSETALGLIVGGMNGITFSGDDEHVRLVEVSDSPFGFAEPGLGQGCRTNGIKIHFSSGALKPDGDGVSYPADSDDPVLVISFLSLAGPKDGQFFVKGGRKLDPNPGDDTGKPDHPVEYLTDGGDAAVPGCRPPVAVHRSSWGVLKQIYH
jgi:hypothetical protein